MMTFTIADAAAAALLGYAVVFFGLILLMCVITLMGKVMAARQKAAAAPAAQPKLEVVAKTAPGTAGQVKLYNVPDKEAAMLMAIVAHKLGRPLNELRFKSIKEVK